MPLDKVVDSAQLNSNLTAVANAIRTKGKTSLQLDFPTGFIAAVQAIETGVVPKLVVITTSGASVTATKGATTLSGTAGTDGTCTLEIPEAGEWNVAVSKDGISKTQSIVIGTQTLQLPLLEENFSDNSWEQIIEACQKNVVPSTWEVGDSKIMTIDGGDYQIDIIGKNHDSYSDNSGTAPITFQLHGLYDSSAKMNSGSTNNGGWKNSDMKVVTMPSILAKMPSAVQVAIKDVIKKSTIGGGSSYVRQDGNKLFLLSCSEILQDVSIDEGTQYAYYANGGSTIKTGSNGSNGAWWTRSAYESNAASFYSVSYTTPNMFNIEDSNNIRSISFGFCF